METETRDFLIGLFREAYEGNWRGKETYFVDNRPRSGLFGTLGGLSAAEASEVILPGTSTIAGQTVHLTIAMAATRDEIDGESPEIDWEGTWAVQRLDSEAWSRRLNDLRLRYEELLSRFRERPWNLSTIEALAYSTAHAAWHLGAIRQLLGERVERQG